MSEPAEPPTIESILPPDLVADFMEHMKTCEGCRRVADANDIPVNLLAYPEEFLLRLESSFGTHKRVLDLETGEAFRVPVRDIATKGLKHADLLAYPRWTEGKSSQGPDS